MENVEQQKVRGKYFKKSLKAKEVLRLYETGERNFQGVILRGQSFKGQDLSGADFGEADIRSTDFSRANLSRANFSNMKSGLQKRWTILLIVLSWCSALISGFSSLFIGMFISTLDDSDSQELITVSIVSLVLVVFIFITIRRGTRAGVIAGVLTGASLFGVYVGIGISLEALAGSQEITLARILLALVSLAIVILLVFSLFGILLATVLYVIAVAGITAGALAGVVAGKRGAVLVVTISVASASMGTAAILSEREPNSLMLFSAIAVTGVFAGVISYTGFRALKENTNDAWVRPFVVALAVLKGNSFYNTNLAEANFSNADLKICDFREANITRLDCLRAKNFNYIRPGNTYLKDAQIREWITGKETNKKFDDKNLRGVSLRKADLTNASFVGSDLSEADLSETTLTGACIQDWNINSQTKLQNVTCNYIFLKEDNQERRPSDPNKTFAPGDFANLVQKSLSTVDLIFSEGIDWQGFLDSFKRLQVEDGNRELVIQAIERKTNGAFVVRVEVPPDADKASIEESFWQKYNPLLEAKDREIKLLSQQTEFYSQQVEVIRTDNTRLIGIVETMAEKENAKYDLRGAKFGGGFAAGGGTQSGGTLNDYSITIGQNIDDIERLIASLRENIQHFPGEQREDAEMELEDLEEEVRNPEKRNPKRLGRRLKKIAAIGTAVTALTGGAVKVSDNLNTFTDNITELGEKLEVPIESIKANLEDWQSYY